MLFFLKNNFRWIAGGVLLTYLSSFGQTFFISGSIGEWQASFDLSHGEIGRLYMLATLASAICLPFVGRLVDVMPAHRVVLVIVPVLAAAAVLAAHAPSVAVLLVAIFLLRLFGQGMMTHTALTATGRWFEAERGRAVSLVVLGHQGGEATLPLLFAAIAVAAGYQTGWLVAAALLLLVGLPLAWWAYRVPRVAPVPAADTPAPNGAPRRDWRRSEVLRDVAFWVLLVGVLAPPFVGTTIFYHQDYFTDLRGWPPRFYALSLSVAAGTTVVFALICGALVDRFRAVTMLPFFLLPLAASCFVLSIEGPAELLFLVMFLLGIAYGLSSTLFGALWPELYGAGHLGAIRSVTVSAMVFATAAGPGLTGTLIDRGIGVPQQMVWIGAYCVVAAFAMAAVSLHLRRRAGVAGS
jgi:MFS family permease